MRDYKFENISYNSKELAEYFQLLLDLERPQNLLGLNDSAYEKIQDSINNLKTVDKIIEITGTPGIESNTKEVVEANKRANSQNQLKIQQLKPLFTFLKLLDYKISGKNKFYRSEHISSILKLAEVEEISVQQEKEILSNHNLETEFNELNNDILSKPKRTGSYIKKQGPAFLIKTFFVASYGLNTILTLVAIHQNIEEGKRLLSYANFLHDGARDMILLSSLYMLDNLKIAGVSVIAGFILSVMLVTMLQAKDAVRACVAKSEDDLEQSITNIQTKENNINVEIRDNAGNSYPNLEICVDSLPKIIRLVEKVRIFINEHKSWRGLDRSQHIFSNKNSLKDKITNKLELLTQSLKEQQGGISKTNGTLSIKIPEKMILSLKQTNHILNALEKSDEYENNLCAEFRKVFYPYIIDKKDIAIKDAIYHIKAYQGEKSLYQRTTHYIPPAVLFVSVLGSIAVYGLYNLHHKMGKAIDDNLVPMEKAVEIFHKFGPFEPPIDKISELTDTSEYTEIGIHTLFTFIHFLTFITICSTMMYRASVGSADERNVKNYVSNTIRDGANFAGQIGCSLNDNILTPVKERATSFKDKINQLLHKGYEKIPTPS